jgi:hypothetical protein
MHKRTSKMKITKSKLKQLIKEARMSEYGKRDAEQGLDPSRVGRRNPEYMDAYNAAREKYISDRERKFSDAAELEKKKRDTLQPIYRKKGEKVQVGKTTLQPIYHKKGKKVTLEGEEESEVFEVDDQVEVYQGPKNPPLVGRILEKSRGGGASLIYYEEDKWKNEWVPNTALTKIAEAGNDRITK